MPQYICIIPNDYKKPHKVIIYMFSTQKYFAIALFHLSQAQS